MVIIAGLCEQPERRTMSAPTLRACLLRDPMRLVDALAERSSWPEPVVWEDRAYGDDRRELSIVIVGIGYAYARVPREATGEQLEWLRQRITVALLDLYADEIEELDAEVERLQAELAIVIAANEAKLPAHLRRQVEPAGVANDPFPADDFGPTPPAIQQRVLGF